MSLSWKEILTFSKQMFDLSQKQIAGYLVCSPSTISRAISGKSAFSYEAVNLYDRLFDPTNDKSPAHGENSESLLNHLKKLIEDAGFQDTISGLDTTDYKTFVIGLIRLVTKNQPTKGKTQKKDEAPLTALHKAKATPKDDTQSGEMRKIFEQEYCDCRINEFLTSGLLHGSNLELLPWVDRFIETLKHDVIELSSNDKSEDVNSKAMYNNICKYTKTLREYKDSLVTHIYELAELRRQEFMSPRIYRSHTWLYNDDNAASVDTAMRYLRGEVEIKSSINVDELLEYHRKKLDALYADICSAD